MVAGENHMNTDISRVLDLLVRYGLDRAAAEAISDPGAMFGHSVGDETIKDINILSKFFYQFPQIETLHAALDAIWPFCAEECGMIVTKEYAEAIQKVAHATGRTEFVLQSRGNGMFYVEGRHDG